MLNVKNKLKQLTALTLAGLTALSSPITALADTGLGGNVAGSSQGGVVTSSGGDFGVNVSPTREGRIGIRLSLVDGKEPSRVISVTPQSRKPMVVDIKQGIFQQTALEYPLSYFWVYCPRDFRPSIPTLRVPAVKGLTGFLLHHLLHHFSILGRYITHLDEISKAGESL